MDPPIATTLPATNVKSNFATFNATVNPNGLPTSAVFHYGLTTGYGSQVPATPAPGSGASPVEVSATVFLNCNTTYHFRISAANPDISTGGDQSVRTAPCSPYGLVGAVQALAVDPENPNTVYAGTQYALYRSIDGGGAFQRVDSGLTYTNFRSLAIDPHNHCTIYGGIDTEQATINTNAIVVVSTNCGTTWGVLPGIPPGRVAWSVAVTSANPSHLYVGLSRNAALDQIARLTPPGTYEFSQPNLSGNYRLATDPANPCTAYAGDFSGNVHKNTTCANWNWTDIGDLTGAVLSLAVHPTNQATVLAGTATGRIYRKADAASPWVQTATSGGPVWSLAYAPGDPLIVYAASGDGNIYRSVDGGLSWSSTLSVGSALPALAVRPVAPSPVYAGGDSFVLSLGAPAGFGKASPSDEAVGLATEVALTWTGSIGAAGYEYCYDTSDDNACSAWTSAGNGYAQLSGLAVNTTYYWQARAMNLSGATYADGGSAAFWSFTTGPPPGAPGAFNKTSPADGATGLSTSLTIMWGQGTGVITGYEYCYDTTNDNACSAWTLVGGPNAQLIGLAAGTTYYWHARAFNAAGTTYSNGGATAFWSFTTESSAPAPFGKIGPADGTTGLSRHVPISWDSSAGTNAYEYCLDTVDNSTCDANWITAGTNTATTLTNLIVGTTYYWQVRAVNGLGPTLANSGTWWSFTVTDFIVNGGFSNGLNSWATFGTPSLSDIVWEIVNGVFRFHRTGTQATVFQQTSHPLDAGVSVRARFDLGNSSSVRKRVSVLILDASFNDLSVCTFWLAPNAPMASYEMGTHSTQPWSNAAIYFYAASGGSNGGDYLLDNVSMGLDPGQPDDRTDCVDPTAPAAPGGAPSGDLLTNGDFNSGALTPWFTFGQIVHQSPIAGGVFEFYRPSGTPSGVVAQQSGGAVAANGILTATFDLGNSSPVRKRVTVLLHDADFSDLSACTFWLEPGNPLSTFGIRTFATKAWSNATVSVYPSTVGIDQWIRLDNVSLRLTPGTATLGTECLEPGSSIVMPDPIAATPQSPAIAGGHDLVTANTTSAVQRLWLPPLHLSANGTAARLTFDAWFEASSSSATVEISLDGRTWETIRAVAPTSHWERVEVDLSPWAGQTIYVRIVVRPTEREP